MLASDIASRDKKVSITSLCWRESPHPRHFQQRELLMSACQVYMKLIPTAENVLALVTGLK